MRVVLAFLFLLFSTVAISQGCGPSNPGCIVTEAPQNSNNNQAASTSYVDRAVAAGPGANAITGLTGDVAATGPGNVAATIQAGSVTSAKMATGAAATNVGALGGSLTGTLPNPTVANAAISNAMLANEASGSIKCQPGASGAPVDCTPNQVSNLLGYCVIDGQSFAATTAGIQSAINTTSCHDIYIPPGTYSGTALVQIARSNVRIRGAGGVVSEQTFASGTTASTILSFSCFNPGANPAVLVGDASATLTYGGVEITDLEILLPATCNMIGTQINTSTTDVPNVMRRVRISQAAGTASGTGIFLQNSVYNWAFEHVIIDHFSQCYRLSGINNLTKILQGSCSDGNVGINANNSLANQTGSAIIDGVDFENMATVAIDIGSADGIWIQNCYFGQGSGGANSLSIRLGATASQIPQGVIIKNNLFNAGGLANYAIELDAAAGFKTLTIQDNTFVGYLTDNVHNLTTTTGANGVYLQNYTDGSAGNLSATAGFDLVNFGGAWTTFAGLAPSCGTATFSASGSAYKQIGKTVTMRFRITISAIGTCNGLNLNIALPFTLNGANALSGMEFVNSGVAVACAQVTTNVMACVKQANPLSSGNLNTWAVNDDIYVSGVFEVQ